MDRKMEKVEPYPLEGGSGGRTIRNSIVPATEQQRVLGTGSNGCL